MSKEKDNNFELNLKKLELIVDKLESGEDRFRRVSKVI